MYQSPVSRPNVAYQIDTNIHNLMRFSLSSNEREKVKHYSAMRL